MQNLSGWLAMGGYAAFVWPAYAIAAIVLGGLSWQSWHRYRVSRDALARMQDPRRSGE